MALDIPAFPSLPRHSYVIPLGGVEYEITYTYRERTASWYIDLRTAAGVDIALGRRLTPGSTPFTRLELPGMLYCAAADGFARRDLGTPEFLLTYYTAVELAATAADSGLTIVIA
jgi:hypothetical protein